MFRDGKSIAEVCENLGRATSTVTQYLADFLESENRTSPEPWVDTVTFAHICEVTADQPLDRLKPTFDALQGEVSYDHLRIAFACVRNLRRRIDKKL
ncbi:hypothetical protein GC163_05345 [bacterium]|nr:hypothetical protein [bacterium]